jgi:VIT1/CCC1 family predicted Fe2+/Mn2+ transporter
MIQTRYERGDANLSRMVHEKKNINHKNPIPGTTTTTASNKQEEGHRPHGALIKSVVYGGLDGILTSFAIVAGAVGGGFSVGTMMVLGISGAFSEAIAMGLGDALSAKAEQEHVLQERQREFWEYDKYLEGEIAEMIALYMEKGMSREDAETVVNLIAPHRAFFVDIMTVEELGLQLPDPDDNPWKDGLVTFTSFVFFSSIPLLGYCVLPFTHLTSHQLLVGASLITLCTLFLLGAIKSMFSPKTWLRSGLEMVGIGSLVALLAYWVAAFSREYFLVVQQ